MDGSLDPVSGIGDGVFILDIRIVQQKQLPLMSLEFEP